jgi:hypothetical protein
MKRLVLLLFLLIQSLLGQAQVKEVFIETDVLVIGGTTSGICAGIQSARLGVKTMIVESGPWLGGMLTSAGVSAFDGNNRLPAGIFGEFRNHLEKHYGGKNKLATGWVSNTLFEPHIGDSIFKSMASQEKQLAIKYHHEFIKAITKNGVINGIVFLDKVNQIQLFVKAKRYIDATELGEVIASANIPYDLGMESDAITKEGVNPNGSNEFIQDITYVAILKDYGTPQPLIDRPNNYDSLEFDGSSTNFYKDSTRRKPTIDAIKMLQYGRLQNNKFMINWPIYGNDIYLNVVEKTPAQRVEILEAAKQQTLRFVYFIQKELGFRNIALADDEFPTRDKLAIYPYYRESRRVKGATRMVVQHITKPFATNEPLYRTGIAVGDYPIDHHHKKNKSAPQNFEFVPVPSFNIPLSVLIPNNNDELIVAEKSISVSNIVNGTTRLQPCVMQIGQAAGMLAAQSVLDNVVPKHISVRKIQDNLLNAQGYIMPYVDVAQNSVYFKAVQKIGAAGLLKGVGLPNGWSNETYFYPNKKVSFSEFMQTWTTKFNSPNSYVEHEMTIAEAIDFAGILSGKKSKKIEQEIADKWSKLSLDNFSINRPILRYELAVLLNEFDVFHVFDVDLYGFIKP